MVHAVDDSPRVSKRRKLNYTDNIEPASSPVPIQRSTKTKLNQTDNVESLSNPLSAQRSQIQSNSTLKRPTRRSAHFPQVNVINDLISCQAKPGIQVAWDSAGSSSTNGALAKETRKQITEADLYDDIEGIHILRTPLKKREKTRQARGSKSTLNPPGQLRARHDEEPGGVPSSAAAATESRSPGVTDGEENRSPTPSMIGTRLANKTQTRTLRASARKKTCGVAADAIDNRVDGGADAESEENEQVPNGVLGRLRSDEDEPSELPTRESTSSKRPLKRRKLAKTTEKQTMHEVRQTIRANGVPSPQVIDIVEKSPAFSTAPQAPHVSKTTRSQSCEADQRLEHSYSLLHKVLMQKLTGKRPLPLVGLDEVYNKVYQLVEQTVIAGEGNSILIVGARGSGKSALVDKALSALSHHQNGHFHVVKLNGFIHTDDKLAIREIWRQLGREMYDEEDALGKNYADTLSTLLAILSHPAELDETKADEVTKSVVFIIDEFDLFTTHARQTLLYNLFDIAQSKKAPIAVLGLTARVDVAENLEKRVKSRFSHRYVHVSLPKSFAAFQEICKAALQVKNEELSFDEKNVLRRTIDTPTSYDRRKSKSNKQLDLLDGWNASIENLFTEHSFVNHLATLYHRTKSIPEFLCSALLPVLSLEPTSSTGSHLSPLTASSFIPSQLAPPDSNLHILPSLSDLELSLLIAAARLDVILDTDTCSFDMVYDEYLSLASKARFHNSSLSLAGFSAGSGGGGGVKIWGREVATAAWEKLAAYDLVLPVGVASAGLMMAGGGSKSERQGRMWRVDVGLEEIPPAAGPCLSSIMGRWCREI